ncbi:Tat pathway signal sequence domain protein [Capnocytophaga canis]|uniref:Tat pathway signal sequence domain protein n=1 Tax=Capnocytophaga canis TaxID=1848903 RepID=A0A0B7HY53_9FLAO|nr:MULTISPECIES: metallophosphatase [Capnocytophaga]ATA72060.1 metallophosphatase [Capnocytophaga sp. H4358]CEN42782.1 Tat pathway signal sequence domain protein [Capnocytophaga canis]CEN53652.1 Tat pathway signal sequence domain protein [Capnocytophaga canis]
MKRRVFIRNVGASSLFVGLGGLSLAMKPDNIKKITILHTNDTHSHIDPQPANAPKNPNRGGVARRAYLVEQIRRENPNTLLFDAGDIFQGTPYFNFYGGELEFKLMSMMGYNASTIGNHDFDNGIDGLYAQLPHAKFDFLIANYDFSNTLMDGYTNPYKVYVIDGIRIGVFGLGVKLENLVSKQNYKETVYLDPLEIALDMERKLKEEEKCDLVICLSHLGYDYVDRKNQIYDLKIAEETSHIDLIIGGHTHTFLTEPTLVTNKKGNTTLVNQVGCFGIQLGRIDFYFEEGKNTGNKSVSIEV